MQAIILAAGQGTRLQPLTSQQPKCMVPVHGRPLLGYMLEALEAVGVKRTVLVVGYRDDRIRAAFGTRLDRMALDYVPNPDFATTNNIYSLWLAREHVESDFLLLESDLLLDFGIFEDITRAEGPATALVDEHRNFMDGTVVVADGTVAERMVLKRDQPPGFDFSRALKTVNVYRFSRDFAVDTYFPALGQYVAEGRNDQYYEAVLADLVKGGAASLGLCQTGGRRWAEIDDVDDLRAAERLFPQGPTTPEKVALASPAAASEGETAR